MSRMSGFSPYSNIYAVGQGLVPAGGRNYKKRQGAEKASTQKGMTATGRKLRERQAAKSPWIKFLKAVSKRSGVPYSMVLGLHGANMSAIYHSGLNDAQKIIEAVASIRAY